MVYNNYIVLEDVIAEIIDLKLHLNKRKWKNKEPKGGKVINFFLHFIQRRTDGSTFKSSHRVFGSPN